MEGYVYVIGDGVSTEHYKVGFTKDWSRRISAYVTALPRGKLHYLSPKLVDAKGVESEVLHKFNSQRIVSALDGKTLTEWVQVNKDQLLYVVTGLVKTKSPSLVEMISNLVLGPPAPVPPPTCKWKMVRGKRVGELCGKPVVLHTDFCRDHHG